MQFLCFSPYQLSKIGSDYKRGLYLNKEPNMFLINTLIHGLYNIINLNNSYQMGTAYSFKMKTAYSFKMKLDYCS